MKKFVNVDDVGMKIRVHLVRPQTEESFAKSRWKKRKLVFVPLLPILVMPYTCNTKQQLAELIYNNFGVDDPDGTTYHIRYWKKVNKWSRRIAKLCRLKLWDDEEGNFKFKFLDMGVLRRFGFWEDR